MSRWIACLTAAMVLLLWAGAELQWWLPQEDDAFILPTLLLPIPIACLTGLPVALHPNRGRFSAWLILCLAGLIAPALIFEFNLVNLGLALFALLLPGGLMALGLVLIYGVALSLLRAIGISRMPIGLTPWRAPLAVAMASVWIGVYGMLLYPELTLRRVGPWADVRRAGSEQFASLQTIKRELGIPAGRELTKDETIAVFQRLQPIEVRFPLVGKVALVSVTTFQDPTTTRLLVHYPGRDGHGRTATYDFDSLALIYVYD